MSVPSEFTTEFELFESDDLDVLAAPSPLQFLDFPGSDTDGLAPFDPANSNPKAILSPVDFSISATAAVSPDSANDSSQDSCSDSASEKRAASFTSSKTPLSSGDVIMADGPIVKPEWSMDDFMQDGGPDNHHHYGLLDEGTINPSTLDRPFAFNDKLMENDFDFDSASSSPSPFSAAKAESPQLITTPAQTQLPSVGLMARPAPPPPPTTTTTTLLPGNRKTAVPVSKQKRHQKAHSQYSLSQSMNGLSTNSSREVSPLSNLMPSQESSPPAIFNNSPSPVPNIDFMNGGTPLGPNPGMWPQGMDISTVMPMPRHMGRPMAHPNGHDMCGMAHYQMFRHVRMGLPDRFQLFVHPTPFKSRVETQIPLKISLFPLPQGVKRLHLPTHTISKPKLLARPTPERCPDMLELSTVLVCTSAMANENYKKRALQRAAEGTQNSPLPLDEGNEDDENKPQNGGEVRICAGCITRERKRAARKKIKKVEEEELWSRDENRRVIVFNTQEIKEWQPATTNPDEPAMLGRPEPNIPPGSYQVECPMRIACYCRHQNEKMGFQVILTIKDFQGRLIAQEMSSSIMITDDHKTHSPPNLPGQTSSSSESAAVLGNSSVPVGSASTLPPVQTAPENPQAKPNAVSPFAPGPIRGPSKPSTMTATLRNVSRPASPVASCGPSTKKRKASGSIKLPTGLAMTPRNAAPPAAAPPPPVEQTSPFTPNMPSFPLVDAIFPSGGPGAITQAFPTGPSTPSSNSNDHTLFASANRSASMDMAMPQLYSAPTSAHPSRAPSPNALRNSTSSSHQGQLSQSIANGLFSIPLAFTPGRPPVIHKIIPNEGPKSGGIEVTILGSGFSQGLEVMFGDQRATTTTFWGETSLVCLLPPSPLAGTVYVTFKQQMAAVQAFPNMQQPIFKYIDDDEQQLIRSALAVLGQKMTGKMEDARELARRILGNDNSWGASGGSGSSNQQSGGGGFSSLSFSTATETQLLKVLELIDLDDGTHRCRWNLKRTTGQTMLHLACALGLHRLVAGLISRGANPEARDKGGFTPMHLAAMNGHLEIVRRLVSAGADPTMRSLSSLTPADVAPFKITRAIRKIERFARSRRFGSLNSRANSATSLRSLWEGPSATSSSPADYSDDLESDLPSEESLEYSSFYESSSEADDTDDGQIIGLRHRSARSKAGAQPSLPHSSHLEPPDRGTSASGLPSPTATMAAWKDQMATQLHQFQQVVSGPFQSIAQFPNLPLMPTFQDYQVFLASVQGMRRLAALMPNIGRPGSSGEQSSNPPDGKWWDSLFPSSPPAYEDLYPQADLDKKQASAAQAAAEAEADLKCASLYDQDSETMSLSSISLSHSDASSPKAPKRQLPKLLQIGRRHAITQEQRENLQQLRSEKLVRCSKDRNLFFIWIPLLLIVICAFLHNTFPSLFSIAISYLSSYFQGSSLEQGHGHAGVGTQSVANEFFETIGTTA